MIYPREKLSYYSFIKTKCELATQHRTTARRTILDGEKWVVFGCENCYITSAFNLSPTRKKNVKTNTRL